MTDSGGDQLALVRLLKAQNRSLAQENESLKGGGGDGTFGGMEPRLAKLEAQMEHVQADLAKLASVPVDVATMKGDMVTKDYLNNAFERHLRWTLGIVGAMIAIATLINTLVHH